MYKGVPQGSILGPQIFNIFMNDLFYFVKQGNLFNYADDNSVSVNHMELHVVSRLLQAAAEVTVKWFSENAMQANPAKCQVFYQKETNMPLISRYLLEDKILIFRNPSPLWGYA